VEILDAASAGFVSITQPLNATANTGRLTLDVLLSFAQFERPRLLPSLLPFDSGQEEGGQLSA